MKFNLTISRDSSDKILIQVTDQLSRARFLDLELTFEQFALAVTGCHASDIDGSVRGLDNVGKKRVIEKRELVLPRRNSAYSDRKVWEKYLLENCQEDGWHVDSYLGSQNSIDYKDDKVILNYSVFKYVDV